MKDELTPEEAAQILKVSRAMVYVLVDRGLLHKYQRPFGRGKGGQRIYFKRDQVETLANARTMDDIKLGRPNGHRISPNLDWGD
jgi:excisionase family DNA binding protein